jgi:hypothetical protein
MENKKEDNSTEKRIRKFQVVVELEIDSELYDSQIFSPVAIASGAIETLFSKSKDKENFVEVHDNIIEKWKLTYSRVKEID